MFLVLNKIKGWYYTLNCIILWNLPESVWEAKKFLRIKSSWMRFEWGTNKMHFWSLIPGPSWQICYFCCLFQLVALNVILCIITEMPLCQTRWHDNMQWTRKNLDRLCISVVVVLLLLLFLLLLGGSKTIGVTSQKYFVEPFGASIKFSAYF
jgi:hypothetical protein